MAYFFCRLNPPRPDFAMTMTDAEKQIMGAHGAYLRSLPNAVVFGPVGDPSGPWGLGVFEADSMEAMKALTGDDPAIKSGAGFRYDVFPMLNAVLRSSLERVG